MKKLFTTFISLTFAACLLAQPTLEIYENAGGEWQKLDNGAVLQRHGDASSEITEILAVKNTSGVDKSVFFKKHPINVITGSLNTFCWAHTCLLPNQTVSDPMTVQAGQMIEDEFSFHFQGQGHSGVSTIRYTAVNSADHTDTVFFDVVYTTSPAGINNFTMSDIRLAPNPASEKVTVLNLPRHYQEFTLELFDATGNLLARQALEDGMEASVVGVNVSQYPVGIYFVRINNHQGAVVTRRLAITR